MLYLVATPIGNLADITLRALQALKECDYILCEDTRHSIILLNHYDIKKPLKSYHKFSETSQMDEVVQDLVDGKTICLISDAGTPGISDPGELLVKRCAEENIPFTALPGPCAAIQALSCSGFPLDRFQFWGFLPKKENELKRSLQEILRYEGTTVCYESPHRLLHVLEVMRELDPKRKLAVCRELTKKFEEFVRGPAAELLLHWKDKTVKGEIVLLISPMPEEEKKHDWSSWTPEEHVKWMEESYGVTRKEAIKLVAELRGVPKREIYNSTQRD